MKAALLAGCTILLLSANSASAHYKPGADYCHMEGEGTLHCHGSDDRQRQPTLAMKCRQLEREMYESLGQTIDNKGEVVIAQIYITGLHAMKCPGYR